MRLTADIQGEQHSLEIKRDGAHVTAQVDGQSYELEARSLGAGAYLLRVGGRVFECRVGTSNPAPEAFEVHVGKHNYTLSLFDPKRLRGVQSSGIHAADGAAQIVANMPGKVVRVLVEAGAVVEAGDGIIVVEAMKMQNEMKAPRAGKVVEIRTAAGATVNAGDVLAIIE